MTVKQFMQLFDGDDINPEWQILVAENDTPLMKSQNVVDIMVVSYRSLIDDKPMTRVIIRGGHK